MVLAILFLEAAALALTLRLPPGEVPRALPAALAAHLIFTAAALLAAGTRFAVPAHYAGLGVLAAAAAVLAGEFNAAHVAGRSRALVVLAAAAAALIVTAILQERLDRAWRGAPPTWLMIHVPLAAALAAAGAVSLFAWFGATRPAYWAAAQASLGSLWLGYGVYHLAFLRGTQGPHRDWWIAVNRVAPNALELLCLALLCLAAARAQSELSLAPAPYNFAAQAIRAQNLDRWPDHNARREPA